jgi:hypothetical protein
LIECCPSPNISQRICLVLAALGFTFYGAKVECVSCQSPAASKKKPMAQTVTAMKSNTFNGAA